MVAASKNIDCLLALLHTVPLEMRKNLCPAAFLCDLDHSSGLQLLLKCAVPNEDLQVCRSNDVDFYCALHYLFVKSMDRINQKWEI